MKHLPDGLHNSCELNCNECNWLPHSRLLAVTNIYENEQVLRGFVLVVQVP